METKTVQRRFDLDWLRVFGILLVFVYHSSRFYNVEDWTIKNNIWYLSVEVWNSFSTSFMMPLMFVISGASLFYALGKGGFGKFFKDKVLRLLIPLVVAVLTHISLQSYIWDKSHGLFSGSYFQFLPQYFNLATLNWNGAHLWYLKYLFLFSLILYPLFRWLKGRGQNFLTKLGGWLSRTGVLYMLTFPFLIVYSLVDADSPVMTSNGGYPYILYLWFILLGFLITSDQRIQEKIRQLRWVSLIGGLLLAAGSAVLIILVADQETITPTIIIGFTMRIFGGWLSVLGFLGMCMQALNFRTPRLDYASEAVLPFYILHQTVLLAVGYFTLQWGLPDVLEWTVTLAASFILIMVIYEFIVRRFNVLRFLFGMKPGVKPVAAQTKQTQLEPAVRR
ncbi:MAG: acyltransferase family protein [Chloroflexi bacterium]|nr:acyltransferase family protein [Chloroflexota bacterium]